MNGSTLNKIIKNDLLEDSTFKPRPKRWEENKSRDSKDELRQQKPIPKATKWLVC